VDESGATKDRDGRGEFDYPTLVAAAADCTMVTGADGKCLYVSQACHHLLGWSASHLEGRSAAGLVHPDDVAVFRRSRDALAQGETATSSYRLRSRDGSFRWVEETSHLVRVDHTTLIVSTVRDITQRQAQVAALEVRAASDPLTGVANRTVLMDRLRQGLRRLSRSRDGLGVLYLDLDRFKIVNDSLGHRAGDAVLLQLAERLGHHLRPGDTLARLGGDEFVIVAEGMADEAGAVQLADRLVATGRLPIALGDEFFECTVSVGVAWTADHTRAGEEMLHEADLALYRAKDLGRDRAEVFDENLRSVAIGRMATERLIRRAVAEGRLVVEYQPIVDLRSGRVLSVEALVRIQDPGRGLLMPESFLDVAEETGLLIAIDKHVLAETAEQAAGWRDRLGDAWFGAVAINVTARHLADVDFRDALFHQLDAHGVAHGELQVEVTEQVLMQASNSAMSGLRLLRDSGVQVGLDDFGTGFSSLAYLRQFPLDFVKIDRSFITDLERSKRERAIVAAIIELAHALDLVVTAEGVETGGQREILEGFGCDRAQGFHFGAPSSPPAIDELVLRGPQLGR
jgi:diguanylate cyclase (GGDEF)-like protein/PAS domain S-box-containing protein